ncbi:MAG TPA: DUF5666 domain-containing protein, partial [Candidatus Krumholzibacteria bacterium]|nr:DUF5666 domain-containing protein [Candidatus Krumholzibacteria bacterium]
GNYAFHRLPAGVYTVSIPPKPGIEPVTPTEITVLLTETEGDVSDFLDANFGVLASYVPPDPFPIGAYIEANGEYATDPDRLVAQGIELARCGHNPYSPFDGGDDDDDDGDNDDYDDERDCRKGKLRGPVTAVDDENGAFAVMGTWVSIDPTTTAYEVEVGQRLDVRVHRADDGSLVADVIKPWHSDKEQVHGRIDEVEIGDDGVVQLKVLDTLVIVTRHPHVTP